MNKLISVIIPVKNGEKYLKEAIEGIQKQNMNVEIIVVNDASTDKTEEIANEMGCTVINHDQCKGPVIAKNTALQRAHGQYIMFHDADDVMRDNALRTLYDVLEDDSSIAAAMGKVKDFISPDNQKKQEDIIKTEPYYGLFTGAVLMRSTIFDTIGPFSENIRGGEIIEWEGKMKEKHLIIKKVDIITTNRRIHDNNFGRTNRATEFQDYAKILRQKLKK